MARNLAVTNLAPMRMERRMAEPMRVAQKTAETNPAQMHPQAPMTAGPKKVA